MATSFLAEDGTLIWNYPQSPRRFALSLANMKGFVEAFLGPKQTIIYCPLARGPGTEWPAFQAYYRANERYL